MREKITYGHEQTLNNLKRCLTGESYVSTNLKRIYLHKR